MDPRTANQIMSIAGVVVVWFILELIIRRGRSKRAMVFDGLIVAIFLGGATLFAGDIPLRVMAVIAGTLLMTLLLMAAIFLIRSMGSPFGFRRKWLAEMGKPRIEAPDALLPDPVKKAVERFEAIGFRRVTSTIDEDGSVIAHLLRADGVLAEAVVDPMGNGAAFDCTSILDGGRGELVTSNTGLGVQLWDGELVQAFPGATAEHLLECHEDGLVFLRERGIDPDPVTPDRLLALRTDLIRRAVEAAHAADPNQLRLEGVRILQRQHGSVGLLRDRPSIEQQIERFRAMPGLGDGDLSADGM
jgi:hypothetical protein